MKRMTALQVVRFTAQQWCTTALSPKQEKETGFFFVVRCISSFLVLCLLLCGLCSSLSSPSLSSLLAVSPFPSFSLSLPLLSSSLS